MEPRTHKLILKAAKLTGLSFQDIMSRSRKEERVITRWMIFHVLYKYGDFSSLKIGRLFNLDHSTVLHGLALIQLEWGDIEKAEVLAYLINYYESQDREKLNQIL